MGQAALKFCPICGKPAVEKYRPFCCAHCANVDLGHWFGGKYVMPTDERPGAADPETGEDTLL